MNGRDAVPGAVAELAIVLVLSAAIGTYLLGEVGRGPGAVASTSTSLVAAFYYPMSFPVDALVRMIALEKPAANAVTVFATIVIQNVLLWLLGRWLIPRPKK